MPLAMSPLSVLCVPSNAIFWLPTALHEAAGQKIGADEIFQFCVLSLSVAKLCRLPGLISFVDTFIEEALRETKFEYYIEQMRSALDSPSASAATFSPSFDQAPSLSNTPPR
jgi:hypothetical protein